MTDRYKIPTEEQFDSDTRVIIISMLRQVLETLGVNITAETLPANLIRDFIKSGNNSAAMTAKLSAFMLEKVDIKNEILLDIIQIVLGHHVFEVASDGLDNGIEMDAGRKQLLKTFNSIALDLIHNSEFTNLTAKEIALKIDNHPAFQAIARKLEGRMLPYSIGNMQITLADALKSNLISIVNVCSFANQIGGELGEFIKESLAARYSAVNLKIDNAYKQEDITFPEVIEIRANAILIKVTMGCFISALGRIDGSVKENIDINLEAIKQAMQIAAQLIGIWNDFGSAFTLHENLVEQLFDGINKTENSGLTLREIFKINEENEEGVEMDTQQLVRYKEEEGIVDIPWKKFVQLIKDANAEHNIAFDFGSDNFDAKRELFEEHLVKVKYLIYELKSTLTENIHPHIRNVILNAVKFHLVLYSGIADYYNKESSAQIDKEIWNLMQTIELS